VDELQSYENNHSDALCPIPREAIQSPREAIQSPHEAIQSFNGDHVLIRPATTADVREMHTAFNRNLDEKLVGLCTSLQMMSTLSHGLGVSPRFDPPLATFPECPTVPVTHSEPGYLMTLHSDQLPPTPATLHRSLPIQDAVIPNLPRGEHAWREAIHQWEEPNACTG
jgi:hypothetical protein